MAVVSIDDYEIGETLGTGNFSIVKLAIEKKTGEKFAIKIIDKAIEDIERVRTEVEILKKVKHENIISLQGFFESDKKIFLVMELVTGGELFEKIIEIGAYSERVAAEMTAQILRAVKYLHDLNIAHRDLKPTNLLLKSSDSHIIKIADFGLSKIVGENTLMQTACGTPIYVAPEVLKGDGYDKEVDMWGVGVIMYIMLCGFPPFFDDGSNMSELFDQIMTGQYDFPEPYWTDISDEAKDLIEHLLVVDPMKRYTAEETLEHPWLKSAAKDTELTHHKEKLRKFMNK